MHQPVHGLHADHPDSNPATPPAPPLPRTHAWQAVYPPLTMHGHGEQTVKPCSRAQTLAPMPPALGMAVPEVYNRFPLPQAHAKPQDDKRAMAPHAQMLGWSTAPSEPFVSNAIGMTAASGEHGNMPSANGMINAPVFEQSALFDMGVSADARSTHLQAGLQGFVPCAGVAGAEEILPDVHGEQKRCEPVSVTAGRKRRRVGAARSQTDGNGLMGMENDGGVSQTQAGMAGHAGMPNDGTSTAAVVTSLVGGSNAVLVAPSLLGGRTFCCSACGQEFSGKRERDVHVRSVHERMFSCSKCASRFKTKSDANRHVRIVHERVRPYRCKLCPSSFSEKNKLRRHRETVHEKLRPYGCPVCSARFGELGNLRQHTGSLHPDVHLDASQLRTRITGKAEVESGSVGR